MICSPKTGPSGARTLKFRTSLAGRRVFDEEEQVQRTADRLHIAPGREGTPVGEVCRKAGISEATYYNWRKKYGGMMPGEMKRLKQLEEENQRLKKLVADLSLDKEILQDVSCRKI